MTTNNTIQDFAELANNIKESYDKLNSLEGNSNWGYMEFAQGLVGDMGDLTKLLMAKKKLRSFTGKDLDESIKHELCDILWSVLVISKELNIDLQDTFPKFVQELNSKVQTQIAKKTDLVDLSEFVGYIILSDEGILKRVQDDGM